MYKKVNKLLGTDFKSNEEVNWFDISKNYKLSEDFIREFRNKVDWDYISSNQVLSEDFIREFKDRVDWGFISSHQVLSESFMREFKDRVDWVGISICQVLGEKFIREFEDKVDWDSISRYQVLSWNFILEFEDRVSWKNISLYQPFIDKSYEKVMKILIKRNELYNTYQETRHRGWFVGYVNNNNGFLLEPIISFNKKVRVFWKDLLMTNDYSKNN